MNSFDHPTADNQTIGELVFRPAELSDCMPRVVDVGARNGMFLLPSSYTNRAELIGFEPNQEEFQKLQAHQTDAEVYFQAAGTALPRFRKETFYDCALWETEEERTFYITSGAGACTMMGETLPFMKRVHYRYPDGDKRLGRNFYEMYSEVVKTETVQCRPLDALLQGDYLLDFLKIDVEGAEIFVLRGAKQIFNQKRVLFVQTEFSTFPYYQGHTLFGEQQCFLHEHGFRLLDMNFDHYRYTRDYFGLPEDNDRAPLFAGDAYFMIDPDKVSLNPQEQHRLAALLFIHGFNSMGLSLLHDSGLLSEQELEQVRVALCDKKLRTLQHRFARWWGELPYAAHRKLAGLKTLLRR